MTPSIRSTILVDLTGFDGTRRGLEYAVHIAERMEAHFVGLYVRNLHLAKTGLYTWGSAYSFPAAGPAEDKLREKAAAMFDKDVTYTGLTSEFRIVDMKTIAPMDAIIAQARLSNLIVTSAETGWNDDPTSQADALGQLVIGAGRPVLIVPEDAPKDPQFGKAIVAWDGSRESARAVFDAVPILKLFDTVEVISVNVSDRHRETLEISISHIVEALTRHDIKPQYRFVASHDNDAKTLIGLAKDADLLVFGAYHHSRLREQVFGGVTFDMLSTPPCPLLVAK